MYVDCTLVYIHVPRMCEAWVRIPPECRYFFGKLSQVLYCVVLLCLFFLSVWVFMHITHRCRKGAWGGWRPPPSSTILPCIMFLSYIYAWHMISPQIYMGLLCLCHRSHSCHQCTCTCVWIMCNAIVSTSLIWMIIHIYMLILYPGWAKDQREFLWYISGVA